MNSEAVAKRPGCLPLIIPSDPRFVTVPELLDLCDGFLLTGGAPMCTPANMAKRKPRPWLPSTAAAMRSPCR
jgi:putative glutamine amidotransferase